MRRTRRPHVAVAGAVLLVASSAQADTFSRGSVSVETRAFDPDDSDETEDYGVALVTRLEIKYRPGDWNLVVRGLARFDAIDDTRNVGTLEDAYAAYSLGRLTLRVGSQILNWSTTEAFHPGDVLNSRNFDSEFESLEKLGEPMVELQLRVFQGALSAYYMPVRIEPNLPPPASRLSFFPDGVTVGDALWIDRDGTASDERFAHQGAVHFSQTFGSIDVGLHVVDHSDRHQPTFLFDPAAGELRPVYHSVTQFGLTYVQVVGSAVLKLEAARRNFRSPDPDSAAGVMEIPDHEQVAAGLEYNWTTAAGHDATVIAEAQAVRQDREIRRQLHVFQGDLLLGYRHAFNDVKGREIVAVFISDVERPYEYVASLRYAQRLSDTWSIGAIARSLRLLDLELNQVQLVLTRNF